MPEVRPGVVSVVVVNYRGADDTIACLAGLERLDWPAERLEVIVVDNASGGDDVARIRAAAPRARLVESPSNQGFAGGCNRGVEAATGEVIAFLNNDARPHPDWVRAAWQAFEVQPALAAVASKVLDWEGEVVDYVDGSMTWFGGGYKREVGDPDSAEYDVDKDVLFGTGAAMFVRAEVFRRVGGFDERFFMFYEDVDLGWRLNLLGYRFRFVSASLAYHRHHQSMRSLGEWRERYLLERNALMTMYKNYGDELLARALPAAMALAVRRGLRRGDQDPTVLDLEHGSGDDDVDEITVAKESLAPPLAIDSFIDHLPSLRRDRHRLQAERRRSDAQLLPLFRQPVEPAYGDVRYLEGHAQLLEAFGIPDVVAGRRRIVVATADTLTERMAGPAIRAFEIAAALSVEHDVELVTTSHCTISHPRFRCRAVGDRELRKLEAWCDVFLFQGFIMNAHPWLVASEKVLVVDIYDPFHLEQLEQAKDLDGDGRRHLIRSSIIALNAQLTRGDFFLCASLKQRDFWLGQLSALGRINPETYDDDASLDSLISIVPFGVTDSPPEKTAPAIRGVVPGIGPADRIILWGGGIYNWFDPLTLIRTVDRLKNRHPDVRLFFLGLKHPNPAVPEMRMAATAQALSDSLGLTDRFVFFNEGWVPYQERQNYLLEADIGVSTHLPHVETAFSYRTRILDYLWAGLPIVATEGDTFAGIIHEHGLGLTVPPEDADALEEALDRMLDDADFAASCRDNIARYVPSHTWSEVLRPLIEFCRSPRVAADTQSRDDMTITAQGPAPSRYQPSLGGDLQLLRQYLRQGGVREVVHRAGGRIRRRSRELLGAP